MRNMLEMVGCSRLPGSHGTVARQKRGIARMIRSQSKRCISFITCIRSRASSRGYTFEACVFEANRFGGEVVVHGRRGSSGTRSFSERYLGSFELADLVISKGYLTFLAIPKTR